MRTAIYFGLIYIGDAINYGANYDPENLRFLAWIGIIMMFMDVIDFFRDKKS